MCTQKKTCYVLSWITTDNLLFYFQLWHLNWTLVDVLHKHGFWRTVIWKYKAKTQAKKDANFGPANSTEDEHKRHGEKLWKVTAEGLSRSTRAFTANLRHSSKWSRCELLDVQLLLMLQHLFISAVGNSSKEWQDWASKPGGRAIVTRQPHKASRCSETGEEQFGRWITFEENSRFWGKKIVWEKTNFLRFSACLGEIPLVDRGTRKRQ